MIGRIPGRSKEFHRRDHEGSDTKTRRHGDAEITASFHQAISVSFIGFISAFSAFSAVGTTGNRK
jgi:hypothetical protein